MKRLLALGFMMFCSAPGAVTLTEIQKRLSEQPVVRAHFLQSRAISGLPVPLSSQGEMVLSQQDGLLWQQTLPFVMTMVLDSERMVQHVQGQEPQVITAENNPQLFQFNHLLRAVFQADQKILEQNFQIDFHDMGDGNWQLDLIPVTMPLNKVFDRIGLRGNFYLEKIYLDDKQGDRTDITFTQHVLVPSILTDDERQRFSF